MSNGYCWLDNVWDNVEGVINFLTSLDGGYCHQGCWGWGGDVAGTAGSRTRVQSKAEGQETLTGRLPTSVYACGCVLANADKRLTVFSKVLVIIC